MGEDAQLLHEGSRFAGSEWTRFIASGIASETAKAFCFSRADGVNIWVPKSVCRLERIAGGALLVKVPVWFAKQADIPL